ncbi:hypothetical protein ACIRRX_32460 [Streptomyces bacillaris]
METTPYGTDLQEKADQPYVPPGGSSGWALFTGARRTGSGTGPDAHVIALRQHTQIDPYDTDKHR